MASTLTYQSRRALRRSFAGASGPSRTTSKGVLDVAGGEGPAVVPSDVLAEEEDEAPVVVLPRPLRGQLGDHRVGALQGPLGVEEHEVRVARHHRPDVGDGRRLMDQETGRVLDQDRSQDAAALRRLRSGVDAGNGQDAQEREAESERPHGARRGYTGRGHRGGAARRRGRGGDRGDRPPPPDVGAPLERPGGGAGARGLPGRRPSPAWPRDEPFGGALTRRAPPSGGVGRANRAGGAHRREDAQRGEAGRGQTSGLART